jgi:1,2-phenylacetyl-CoA epoxidase catalytic subunit
VETLQGEELLKSGNQELRHAYLDRVGPLLEEVGVELRLGQDQTTGRWEDRHLPWERWNRLQRRLNPQPAAM